MKAQDILRELQNGLDRRSGGEFAERMYALYDFMIAQLRQANLQKELAPIQTVERLLTPIRDAWSEMLARTSDARG